MCALEPRSIQAYERVFLARREGSARSYNQNAVERLLLNSYNFTSIYLEDYEIQDQVKIFRNAKAIVGQSGAAWTNILFCAADAFLVSWLPSNIKDFSAYSSLAAKYDLNIFFLEAEQVQDDQLHTEYILCCQLLDNFLALNLK
jgi:capsular polysaccharide biosynthesis protein